MKMIGWRLCKLEAALLPQPETWQMQQLRQRIEAGRKRFAAFYGQTAPARTVECPRHLSVADRLHAGRMKAHQQWLARQSVGEIATDNGWVNGQ